MYPQRTNSHPSVYIGISVQNSRCNACSETNTDGSITVMNIALWSSSKRKPGKCIHQPLSLKRYFYYHVANRLEGCVVRPVADVSPVNTWFWSFSCEMRWFDFFVIKDDHQTIACSVPPGRGARFLFHWELSRSVIWEMVEVQSKTENAWNAGSAQMALVAPSL